MVCTGVVFELMIDGLVARLIIRETFEFKYAMRSEIFSTENVPRTAGERVDDMPGKQSHNIHTMFHPRIWYFIRNIVK